MRSPPTPMARKLASIAGMHRIDAKDLALAVGVSHQSAKQWLNGAYAPAGVNLENLAYAFGIPMEALGTRYGEAQAIQAAADAFDKAPIRRLEQGEQVVPLTAANIIANVAADTERVVPLRDRQGDYREVKRKE